MNTKWVLKYWTARGIDKPQDTFAEIRRCLAGAAREREQLEARFETMLELHGYSRDDLEAELLFDVVYNSQPYDECCLLMLDGERE